MNLTKEQLKALEDDAKLTREFADNFADFKKKMIGRQDKLEAMLDKPGDPNSKEWKEGRPWSGQTEPREENPAPLVFVDSEGKEHKALRLKDRLSKDVAEDFSVGKILRAKILGEFSGLNDFEMKAAGEITGGGGGWLVSEQVSARVVDLARNMMVVQKAGAATIPMDSAEMRLTKITSDPTAQWVAEHGEITESEWELEPINLKARTIGVLVRSSLELLEDAKNAGSQLERAMAAALALEVDRVGLFGDGVNEPRGLDLCSDINKISQGVNGGALTNYDPFSHAVEDVADHNGPSSGLAVIFAPRTFYTLDRLKAATTNQPLVPPQSFIDLNKFVTNQIGIADTQGTCTTASKSFIGDFKQILYGIRKNLEVEFTRQGGTKTFAKCQALIRCRMRMDVAVLRENHFTRIAGIKV